MLRGQNDAPLLLDVSRLIWRRWSGTRATGIDRICLAWLKHYASRAQAVVVHRRLTAILPEHTSRALFRLLLRTEDPGSDTLRFRLDLLRLGLRHAAHLRDRLPGRGRVWLNPGHTGLDLAGLSDWCRQRDILPVYLVHDLIPITHPQFCRDGEEQRHRQRMLTILESAQGLVANSHHTLASFMTFAHQEDAKMVPAVVAWPGVSRLPVVASSHGSQEPTFVVLGTIEGRKNHKLLLEVWKDLLVAGRASTAPVPKLVIVGRRGWQAEDVFAALDKHDFQGKVEEVGPLDDERLAVVLGSARALLFPSLAEGFGIPLIEALSAGVPVIASDLDVFREIGQGVPELLPASDAEQWRQAILDYARPVSPRRAQQLGRMSGFVPPSWEDHFKAVDRLIAGLEPRGQ